MKIGAQLYTVRNACKTPEAVAETLKRVADIGYRYVQISGVCQCDPTWLRAELDKNGLSAPLTHVPEAQILENTEALIAEHDILGCKHIGIGGFKFVPSIPERYKEFCTLYKPAAAKIAAEGKYFMYHNHAAEFQKLDGKTILARLAEDFPAELMGFTLDTYWVQVGGGDPADWLTRLAGRVPCIHLKDYAFGAVMSVVGEGNINFDRVFAAAEAAGTEFMLVEQDSCGEDDPFDCLKRSYDFLHARGF